MSSVMSTDDLMIAAEVPANDSASLIGSNVEVQADDASLIGTEIDSIAVTDIAEIPKGTNTSKSRYVDSDYSDIYDRDYYRIGLTCVELFEPRTILIPVKHMKAGLYNPKHRELQLVSIVFDSSELNQFYKEVMPISTSPANVIKKHLTLALVSGNVTDDDKRYLREVEVIAQEFCRKPKLLKLSVIKATGCDVVGSYNELYWSIHNDYLTKLNFKDSREPHISF